MMSENNIYYHFVAAEKKLRFDQSDQVVAVGLKLKTDEPIELCAVGFHASKAGLACPAIKGPYDII